MKILVACEESQAVTIELRKLGHEAYSCDIEECSGGHPEWHLQQDVTTLLHGRCSFKTIDDKYHAICRRWDMIIAFPPCTYLSNAGARHLYPNHVLNEERYQKGLGAKEFFMMFYNTDCDKIAIENPLPSGIYGLPKHSQVIQPYQFGHPFKKRTQLWLKGLPLLEPTDIVSISQSTKIPGNWFNKGGKERQKNRSKTFPGIAKAIATQWTQL
jgi:hypothetical protein